MGLSGFVFTQLLSKITVSNARLTGVKTEFNVKWPFNVIQGQVFWDQWKPYEGLCISLCHKAGLVSKVSKDTASENTKIAVVDNPEKCLATVDCCRDNLSCME